MRSAAHRCDRTGMESKVACPLFGFQNTCPNNCMPSCWHLAVSCAILKQHLWTFSFGLGLFRSRQVSQSCSNTARMAIGKMRCLVRRFILHYHQRILLSCASSRNPTEVHPSPCLRVGIADVISTPLCTNWSWIVPHCPSWHKFQ